MYEARHIEKFLEINSDKLLHWVRRGLIKPKIEGKGRGGRSKFSFENLLDLALIKELADFGMELHSVKAILEGKKKQWSFKLGEGLREEIELVKAKTPWQVFKEDRKLHEREGLWLMIEKFRGEFYWTYGKGEKSIKAGDLVASKAKIIVSISGIVNELEGMTEQKL